ncbi:MAG: SixA phosphatase family protein [Myxococcota bacterium]
MRVLLMRHGPAVDPGRTASDSLRWLTQEGRRVVRGVVGALEELGLRWTHVFTSPLPRAVQTAEIVASPPWFDGPVEVNPALAPDDGTAAQVLAPLEAVGDGAFAVIVGHEPRIRVLAGHLLGVDSFPAFRSGGACLVRWAPGAAALFELRMDPDAREPIRDLGGLP